MGKKINTSLNIWILADKQFGIRIFLQVMIGKQLWFGLKWN